MSIDLSNNFHIYEGTINDRLYLMPYSAMIILQKMIINGQIKDYSISNFFQNNSDYFVKCHVFPFDLRAVCQSINDNAPIKIGKKTFSTFQPREITNNPSPPIVKWFSFKQTRLYNNFLDFAPYTKMTLYVPFLEPFNLPLEQIYGKTVNGYLSLDAKTGYMTVWLFVVMDDGERFIEKKSAKISMDIPIGKSNAEEKDRNNILQAISALGSVAGIAIGAYTGNAILTAGSVGVATRSVIQTMNNNVDRLSSYNGSSGRADEMCCDKNVQLIIERPQNIQIPDKHLVGKPCEQTTTLQSLSGFTKVGEIHFNPMDNDIITLTEIDEIVALLIAGVHL